MANEKNENKISEIKTQVYQAARDGKAGVIHYLLRNVDNDDVKYDILNHYTEEDGQNTTPLIIAAKNGNKNVAVSLLEVLRSVDLERTGRVTFAREFGEEMCRGVTALWCATAAQHFDIVKLMVVNGADINHSSINDSSPLRVACLKGNVNIVQYLLDHNADLNIAYKNKSSCLMASCIGGNIQIVKCLVDKGADLDFEGEYGTTALHIAAKCGKCGIVKLLIDNGASIKGNNYNVTPLMTAAAFGNVTVVNYLTALPKCTRREKIEALELLGASFTDRGSYGMVEAYTYLKEAIAKRYNDPDEIIDKVSMTTDPAYGNKTESKTLRELENIRTDYIALHMESLLIRERVLGLDPIVSNLVVKKGDALRVEGMFAKSINLWLHALKLNQKMDRPSYHVNRFAPVFDKMSMFGPTYDFESLLEVFRYISYEVQLEKEWLSKGDVSPENDAIKKMYRDNILDCVYIIINLLEVNQTAEDKESIQKAVYDFIKLKPALENGYTPLHISCEVIFPKIYNFNSIRIPHPLLCKTLIDCGARVNALDEKKNTPLHVIAKSMNTPAKIDILNDTLMCLIENGAHVDICDEDGKTALDVATTDIAKAIIRKNDNTNLKCLAARAIMRHQVAYKNYIPASLQEYVGLH